MGSLNHENVGQWDYVLSQIEFAYNNVSNRSSRKSLFKIIYIGPPLHTLDLIPLPRMLKLSIISNHMEKKIIKCLWKSQEEIKKSTANYKIDTNKYRRFNFFTGRDQVIVHLWKERFPIGEYNKLKQKRLNHFPSSKKSMTVPIYGPIDNCNIYKTFNVQNLFNYHRLSPLPYIWFSLRMSSFKWKRLV